MALNSVAVTPTASTTTLIYTAVAGDLEVWIQASPGFSGITAYVGDSGVTASDGLRVPSNGTDALHFRVRPGDEIYAYATTTGNPISMRVMVRSA